MELIFEDKTQMGIVSVREKQLELTGNGFFFLADSTTFSYAATCLADGLNQLGISVYSNINYRDPLISDFAFTASEPPEDMEYLSGVVVNIMETAALHNQIVRFTPPHPRTVIHCMHDNVSDICFPDLTTFCTHESSQRLVEGPRIPIAFGLSSAIMRHADNFLKGQQQRNRRFLANFRPSEGQPVRAALDLGLLPKLREQYEVDTDLVGNGRWSAEYYQHLSRQFACLAYGGCFSQDLLKNDWFQYIEPLSTFLRHTRYLKDTVILRWDSWRFWESLAFGCVTLHLDFEQYGFRLPVMPENWKHYIGLDLANLQQDLERILDERERLPEIALAGRAWAIEHYSPQAVAKRFINDFKQIYYPQDASQAC